MSTPPGRVNDAHKGPEISVEPTHPPEQNNDAKKLSHSSLQSTVDEKKHWKHVSISQTHGDVDHSVAKSGFCGHFWPTWIVGALKFEVLAHHGSHNAGSSINVDGIAFVFPAKH